MIEKPFNPKIYTPQDGSCVLNLSGRDVRGDKIYDRSGKGNHGTITGAVLKPMNYGLPVLSFDGVDDYCYDDQTEVLTLNGWKLFKDLKENDKVATLNPKTEQLEYHKPDRYISYDYRGKMFQVIGSNQIDLCVIPEHKMFVSKYKSANDWRDYELIEAKDIFDDLVRYKKDCKWQGKEQKTIKIGSKEIEMDTWLAFLGYFLSEGSLHYYKNNETKSSQYQVIISQSKKANPDVCENIEAVLDEMGYKYSYIGHNYYISNKELYKHLENQDGQPSRFIPQEIKQLSSRQLTILFYALMEGDGHRNNYYTISKQLADDVQEIVLKIGKSANINQKKWSVNDLCTVQIQTLQTRPRVGEKRTNRNNAHNEWVDYNGKVYSCEVKNHILYVRRNGKTCWSGNCNCGNDESLNITDAITIEAWVKLTSKSGTRILLDKRGGYVGSEGYRVKFVDGTAYIHINNAGSPFSVAGDVIVLDTWQHFTVTFIDSFNEAKLYRNGELLEIISVTTQMAGNDKVVTIGTDYVCTSFFNGTIDEVRIYNRALSAEEISKHFNELRHIYGI